MHSVEFTLSVKSLLILSYTVCYTTYCMAQIQSKIQELRDELYDVVNELCNQMKLLRNELVELQHAIYTTKLPGNNQGNNQENYQDKTLVKSMDPRMKFIVQEKLK